MDDTCEEANGLFFCVNRRLACPHEGITVPEYELGAIELDSELTGILAGNMYILSCTFYVYICVYFAAEYVMGFLKLILFRKKNCLMPRCF